MKKIEELLKLDTRAKFHTPKKLNRSSKLITAETVEQLEDGIFTSEMIDQLAGEYPVYRYRTCITVHGIWPEVSRTRIGGYKNVHQNQNGSVEIYYSAIDKEKINRIREGLQGTGTAWTYSESSTGRNFHIMKAITKETLQSIREELEPLGKELAEMNIYGFINLYVARTPWGQAYLVLSLHPLAIPETEVSKLILKLSGQPSWEAYEQTRAAYKAQQEEDRRQREQEYEATRQRIAAEQAKAKQELETRYRPQVAHLKECRDLSKGILVGIATSSTTPQIQFVFYRKDGNGSFGRVKYSKALSPVLNAKELQWKEMKQAPEAEILRPKNTYYLLEETSAPQPRKPAAAPTGAGKVLMTINY